MRIRVFDSDKGDCLLLESDGGSRILCDGGMYKSMERYVAPHLAELDIDLVHVSHVDQDHIAGILQLLENAVEWKVFRQHQDEGDDDVREPRVPRPPNLERIWNNSFREQVPQNRGAIEDLLAYSAAVLQASQVNDLVRIGNDSARIATSIRESLKVSRLIQPEILDIPVNEIPGERRRSRLIMRRRNQGTVPIGDFRVTILGPSEDELEDLREGWDNWLNDNRGIRRELDRYVDRRIEAFENGANIDPFDLHDWNGVPAFRGVTIPNVASIVLLIEADGQRVLITGDAQQDILLEQLEAAELLDRDGGIHLDVLKIQHHGSEHNSDENFCRRVSADHYIFTGNGKNTNPELPVINMYWRSRLGPRHLRTLADQAQDRAFTFHFSTHSRKQVGNDRRHMRRVQRRVGELFRRSDGMMARNFNRRDFTEIVL